MKTSIEELEKKVKKLEKELSIKILKEDLIKCILKENDEKKLKKIKDVVGKKHLPGSCPGDPSNGTDGYCPGDPSKGTEGTAQPKNNSTGHDGSN